MNIPTKKLNTGFEMPVFGLGTYGMGEGAGDQKEINAIKTAVEAGISHIDTAEVYANGHCEELVGEAIKNYDRRKLFLVSKVAQHNLSYRGINQAIQDSLTRLQTDYLDLYLMHRCPGEDKFEETTQAMNELVDQNIVKYIGISNVNAEHTKALCALTKHPFVVNQVHYNLQFREPVSDGLLEFCQSRDMFLEAWRPVNKGDNNKSGTNITKQGIDILDEMCKKYKKTPAQIAINWLISQKNVITLAKSTNIDHLKENLGAIGWDMEPEDINHLGKEFPDQKFVSDTVPLA